MWAFPRQEDVAGADLEGVGLSRAKIRSIAALAEADLDLSGLTDLRAPRPADRAPRDRRLDGRLVPGPHASGARMRLPRATWACARRSRAGSRTIRSGPRRVCARPACGFGEHANLAVHYLLAPDAASRADGTGCTARPS